MERAEFIKSITRKDGIRVCKKQFHDTLYQLTEHFSEEYNIKDRVEILAQNLETDLPVCQTCGVPVHWSVTETRFAKFCSVKCCNSNKDLNKKKSENRDYQETWSKSRETCKLRYGAENIMQSLEGKRRCREGNRGLLGGANPETRKKMELTCLERYGQKIPKMSRISKPHRMLVDWLENETDIKFSSNSFEILKNQEIDIWIPDRPLAIEINGIYWHSEKVIKNRNYHEEKFRECERRGIPLLQFWDFEIADKFDLVKSMIMSHCGLNRKIGARECSVIDLDPRQTFDWLQKNHIQGGIRKKSKALVYQNEIVSVMILTNDTLERFASKRGLTVVGGMSRLLSKFEFTELKTFSDNRYSDGKVYATLGFECSNDSTGLKYYYTKDFRTLEPRWKFMKRNLKDIQKNETEFEYMKRMGYTRVWGCSGKTWKFPGFLKES